MSKLNKKLLKRNQKEFENQVAAMKVLLYGSDWKKSVKFC